MLSPAGFCGNIFFSHSLHKFHMTLHDRMLRREDEAGESGMRKCPLRGLRTRSVPGIGQLP